MGNIVDDGGARYGGYVDRDSRKIIKEKIAQKQKNTAKIFKENVEAGSNVVQYKDPKWKENWNKYKETSSVFKGNHKFN